MTELHVSGTLGSGQLKGVGPSVRVQKNVSTTALAPVGGAQVGQPVTLSATVTGGADGDSVEFFDGATKIGAGALANGVATLAWTPTTRGDHSITAKFVDTARAVGSTSAPVNANVSQADAQSSTTLAPISGAQVGKSTNLKATVSASGTGGSVTFKVGGTVLASVPVAGNGEATYAWVPTVAGAQTVEAVFSGRSGVTGSSTTANVTVAEQPAGTTSSTTDLRRSSGPGRRCPDDLRSNQPRQCGWHSHLQGRRDRHRHGHGRFIRKGQPFVEARNSGTASCRGGVLGRRHGDGIVRSGLRPDRRTRRR